MIHFISDLHLAAQTPGVARRFLHYLDHDAHQAEQLFILGDLFEAWPGDDCIDDPDSSFNQSIVDALRRLSDSGVELSVMHGNRDFLLGDQFAARSGARLIPDPFMLALPSQHFVLAHGDALCTNDTEYQIFRAEVRSPTWSTAFLGKPLAERKAIAAALRLQSERSKEEKLRHQRPYEMDLNPAATEMFLREHHYTTFIPGHTHLPARHEHCIDGRIVERWVLADWHEDRGEVLCFDGTQLARQAL